MFRIFIFILLFPLVAASQSIEQKMPWSEERPLEWTDFQAPPDHSSHFHANTSSGILYSWSVRTRGSESEFLFEVSSGFHPEASWVKPGTESEHLLRHEQLHFDITELYARKLRKALEDYRVTKNIKRDLDVIYKKYTRERKKMQERFDSETAHSQNKEAQQKWEIFVRSELKKYEHFSL